MPLLMLAEMTRTELLLAGLLAAALLLLLWLLLRIVQKMKINRPLIRFPS